MANGEFAEPSVRGFLRGKEKLVYFDVRRLPGSSIEREARSVLDRLQVQTEDALQFLDGLGVLTGDYMLRWDDALGDRSVKM